MSLTILTVIHIIVSLAGLFTGFIVLFGLLAGKQRAVWTRFFLATTVATSVTGFFFPVQHFLPSHGAGIISLAVLAVAIYARSSRQLNGGWAKVYAVSAVTTLYLNLFVAIVQAFLKIPDLKVLAPTQAEPPFKFTQLAVLLLFVGLAIRVAVRSGAQSARAPQPSV